MDSRAMTDRTLDNTNAREAKAKILDLVIVGDGDAWRLLCKASSKAEGWMKSTKAMEIPGVGCLVQVTTQQGHRVAEAVSFVPGVRIVPDVNDGRKLAMTDWVDVNPRPAPVVDEGDSPVGGRSL